MKKYFAKDFDDERCYTLDYIIDEMRDNGTNEMIVFKAIRETKADYFYCIIFDAPGDKHGSECGFICPEYFPRNGKSGCCVYNSCCYVPGEAYILTANGKIRKLK
jgi:hypothetical protein